ncbi:MAG: SusC/RagA family TonB-linked outer membrane protein, partial [Bacteroides sp.]|nr:SusC/RagA family TonB-linked outer membrane protein [Bacteroides sp.]
GNGVTNFNLTINQGFSNRAYKDYETVGMMDYYPMQWEMMKNSYITSGKSAAEAAQLASAKIGDKLVYNPFKGIANDQIVGTDGKLNPSASMDNLKWGDDLDWEDAAFSTGHRQEYNLSYTTKTDKSDTYASVAYLNDKGYMKKTNFERYSGRLNYNVYPTKWFKTGLNLALTRVVSDYSTSTSSSSSGYSNLTRFIRGMAPIYPVHAHNLETGAYVDAAGNPTTDPSLYIYDYDGQRIANAGRDALAETEFNHRYNARNNQNATTYVSFFPIEGLTLTANYSYNNYDLRRSVYENPWVGDGTAGPGRQSQTNSRTTTQTLNQLISYNKDFGQHTVDVMLGHENYSYKYEYSYGQKLGEIVHGIYELSNFVSIASMESQTDEYKKEGYFGRLNYDYADKYYFSASYRHDGSSRFSKDNRWGDFWSFGASWRISEEDFMKDITWVNSLKLRASYGETGNDHILDSDGYNSYYPYQTLYTLGKNNGLEAGAFFFTIANSNLKWETQVSTDFGIEFSLFDRLNGTVEYFKKESKDLLFDVSQPASAGVTSIIQNIGKVSNSGIEIDLSYDVIKGKDWNLTVGANATFLKNKIEELPATMKENGYISGSKKWMEGKSIYEFWLRQWAGVDPATGDGLWVPDTENYDSSNASYAKTLVTVDGQTYTNSYTYAKYDWSGTSTPDVFGGFNFRLGYKNIDLAATFSYQLGGKLIDAAYSSTMSGSEYGYSMNEDLKKAWKNPGDITDVPRLDNNATHNTNIGQTYSTRFLTSSDYLNLRSVSLGYSFPKSLLNKIALKNARLNLTCENVFMIKARQGLNPMSNFGGYTYNEYMPARTFTIGLNVGF